MTQKVILHFQSIPEVEHNASLCAYQLKVSGEEYTKGLLC